MLPLERLAFGVTYQPHYRVRDSLGRIVDDILYGKNTPFNAELFPLSEATSHRHLLRDSDATNSLGISERDVVLKLTLQSKETPEVADRAYEFEQHVLATLQRHAGLESIVRYGMLLEFAELSGDLQEPLTQHYLRTEATNAVSMHLRFVRRLPTEEGFAKKGVNDYRNVIYTIVQGDDGKAQISLDYQEYFDPNLSADEAKKRVFSTFARDGLTYLDDRGWPWLSGLLKKGAAA